MKKVNFRKLRTLRHWARKLKLCWIESNGKVIVGPLKDKKFLEADEGYEIIGVPDPFYMTSSFRALCVYLRGYGNARGVYSWNWR